jgi:hypothetical protein
LNSTASTARALIKWLENLASQEGYNEIGIGVGLYRDYGPAQQLYFQLGYIPDGMVFIALHCRWVVVTDW